MNLNIALLLMILAGGVGGIAGVQAALSRPTDRRGRGHTMSLHRHG